MSLVNLLAFDLGAESGRAILGRFNGERLLLSELHRFFNGPVRLPATRRARPERSVGPDRGVADGLHWDVLRLWSEIKHSIALALRDHGRDLTSIGVDAWGVDFALLDRDGVLVGNPYHYRDARTDGMLDEAFRRVSRAEIFQRTGIQFMQINSLYQLLSMALRHSPALEMAADGIIGTGVFERGRMTLDFGRARLVVARSSERDAAGNAVELRIVGDAKLMAPIQLQDQYAIALLDSGADVAAVSPVRLRELFPDQPLTTVPIAGLGVGEGEGPGITMSPGVKLELWGRTYDNYSGMGLDVIDTLLSPILGVQTQVLLGMPIFRDMNSWTIDYPRRRMWVEWVE